MLCTLQRLQEDKTTLQQSAGCAPNTGSQSSERAAPSATLGKSSPAEAREEQKEGKHRQLSSRPLASP